MEEIWKDVVGYEGLYQVSNLGRVRSLDRIVKHNYGGPSHKSGKLKSVTLSRWGYRQVNLWKNNIQKVVNVYRLEYEAFYGPIPEGMQVNHINEIKTDDRLENLNLMTPKENCNWGTRTQRCVEHRNGKTAPKRIIQCDMDGNVIGQWESSMTIERQLSLSHQNILKCCNGKIKSAYGYMWRYAS